MRYLLSTSELETSIEDIITEFQGHCFPAQVSNLMGRIVDCFNVDERLGHRTVIELLDDLGDDFTQLAYSYQDMLGTCRPAEHIAQAQYYPKEQVVAVTYLPVQPEDPMIRVKATLEESLDRGDFIPEKLRSAYATILES